MSRAGTILDLVERKDKGSYLDNVKMPKVGDTVWFLKGFNLVPTKGEISTVTNIDQRGLANTYMDIKHGGSIAHVSIDLVYDHKPKKVKKQDQYGELTVWE